MSSDARNDRKYNLLLNGIRIPVKPVGGSRCARIKCEVVGEYYVGTDRTVQLGRQKARHYCPPLTNNFSFDLNTGFDQWVDWTEGHSEHLDIFQKWFLKMATEGHDIGEILRDTHVVIGRGILRRITSTPSLINDVNWRVVAQKRNGIIFMYADNEEREFCPSPLICQFRGMSFETYITCGENECSPGPMTPVKSSEQFRTVCRLEVLVNRRKFNILLTGEVDAVDEDGEYVEIKTANESADGLLTYSKCVTTWLQCTLADVKNVVVGYKDEHGFVKKIKEMKKDELVSKMSKAGRIGTQDNFLFLHRLIDRVDDHLQEGETCAVSFEARDRHAFLTRIPEADSVLFEEFSELLGDM